MAKSQSKQVIHLVSSNPFIDEVDAFLIDRQARGLSANTVRFYRKELTWFADWLGAVEVPDMSSNDLRRYLVHIAETRNPGGVHCAYRSLRAFCNWYEEEEITDDWVNPIRKVKSPKVPQDELTPVALPDLRQMLAACGRNFNGCRDRCAMLALLDTGCRASEFVALNVADVNLGTGAVMVREGKGSKFRTVFLGAKCRREMVKYMRYRKESKAGDALWLTVTGGRLTYAGLRQIVVRSAQRASVTCPSLHSFRRAFALACLRSGMDLISLQRLMGHSDLTVLRRYLNQTSDDLADAHARCGPVDCLL